MPMKHFTIPFFIPLKGCPNLCVFCDQSKITGKNAPLHEEVAPKIEKYLSTMPAEGAHIEVGFFGGSFTGLRVHEIESYLKPVREFIDSGRVKGIRISTRPDLIDEEIIKVLKKNKVICIELGVQSMSEDVLEEAKRGHTSKDTVEASRIILGSGIKLGHQMMVGLPGSTYEDEQYTASRIKELGATEVRIYPVIIIKGTELARSWRKGEYKPLPMDEAVLRSGKLINYFEANGVKVIRCGLHPSEGLTSGDEFLAGPFHPAFGQKARQCASGLK